METLGFGLLLLLAFNCPFFFGLGFGRFFVGSLRFGGILTLLMLLTVVLIKYDPLLTGLSPTVAVPFNCAVVVADPGSSFAAIAVLWVLSD